MADRSPVTREHLQRTLVVNAATKPVNVAVPAAVVVAGILVGAPWLLAIAVVVYAALALMTFFDEDEARRVGERASGRTGAPAAPQLDARSLAPPIRAQLEAARQALHPRERFDTPPSGNELFANVVL
jgi:hypothetical protein